MAHASPYFATLRSRKLGKFRSFKAALDQEAPRVVNEMLRERDWLGQTLLHEALVQHAPPHTIDELLSQYPSSAKAKTNRGELPITLAIRYRHDVEVLEMILHRSDQSLKQRAQGQLLFTAIRCRCPDDIILFW
jgi:hypothetical protein